jgi:peroxiredoxin
VSVPAEVTEIEVSATANTWAFGSMAGAGIPDGEAGQLSALIGEPAPDFEIATLEGGTFKLGESLGKEVVVLDFWATWCGPCIKALPDVMAAVGEFEDQGVRLIGVNQSEAAATVSKFLAAKGWKMEVVLDNDAERPVRELFGVTGIPTTFIIGKDGKVSMMHSGYSPGLKEELVRDIKRALQ